MKYFILVMSFVSSVAFAASAPKLNDPAILGEYALAKADPQSELKVAQIRYNADGVLVLWEDRQQNEFELTATAGSDVVYDEDGEANCDGAEPRCLYDSRTVIRLATAKNARGKLVPQVTIEITVSNAWDDEGKEDEITKYVLNWHK